METLALFLSKLDWVLPFLIVLTVLVFFHELGHYWIARRNGVRVEVKGPSQFGNLFAVLLNFLPLVAFAAIVIFMMRQAGGANNQAMSFGKSRAKMFSGQKPTVTFMDVAGQEDRKSVV